MSKLDKLIQKLLRDLPELSYNDVYYLLTQLGFQGISNKGSHHAFRNEQKLKITIPKQGGQTVKRTYLRQIMKLLELDK